MWLWELRAVSLSHAVFFPLGVRIGEGVDDFGHHLHACDTLQRLVLRHLAVGGDDEELTWLHRTTHLLTYLHVSCRRYKDRIVAAPVNGSPVNGSRSRHVNAADIKLPLCREAS